MISDDGIDSAVGMGKVVDKKFPIAECKFGGPDILLEPLQCTNDGLPMHQISGMPDQRTVSVARSTTCRR